jgi:hypothetical protein
VYTHMSTRIHCLPAGQQKGGGASLYTTIQKGGVASLYATINTATHTIPRHFMGSAFLVRITTITGYHAAQQILATTRGCLSGSTVYP